MGRQPERTGVGGKWPAPAGAVGLRGSSTVVGLHFAGVAAGGSGFAGSVPIAGKVQLEGLWMEAGLPSPVGDLHELQLAIATGVPASQAAVDAGEQLFPRGSSLGGEASTIFWCGGDAGVFVPLTTVVAMNGRRFIGRVTNRHALTGSEFYIGLVMHRVVGGSTAGDPPFLSGEEIKLQ